MKMKIWEAYVIICYYRFNNKINNNNLKKWNHVLKKVF